MLNRASARYLTVLTLSLHAVAVLWAAPGFAAPRGSLTIGIPFEVPALDPVRSTGTMTDNVVYSALEPLVYLDPQGNIKPLLAESWEAVDPVTYVFRLRQGVKFHNGEPLTGKAVEFSWRRAREKRPIAFGTVARIDHLDDYTIRMVTNAPDPVFLKKMAHLAAAILPPKYTADQGDEAFGQRPVGTGPFVFAEWAKGSHITFKANPNYYLPGVPKIETLVWRVIPEVATRIAAVRTGEVDIAVRIPPHQVAVLERESGVRVASVLSAVVYFVGFNNLSSGKATPIMDSRVRVAINLGVDVQTIIRTLMRGQAERVNSVIGNVQFGHDPTLPPLPYDPARAKQLLAEAGYPQGFKMGMGCPSGAYANDKEVCLAITDYLQRLGIQAELQVVEPQRYWDLLSKKQLPPLHYDSMGDRFLDADYPLRQVLTPGSKWATFEKKEFSDLILEAGSTIDSDQRRRIYAKLARLLQADPSHLYLWQARQFEGVRKRVQGYAPRSNESLSHIAFEVSLAD